MTPRGIGTIPIPRAASASILPFCSPRVTQTHLQGPGPGQGSSRAASANSAPARSTGTLPLAALQHTPGVHRCCPTPATPSRVRSSHEVPPLPLLGMQPRPQLLQTRGEGKRGVPRGRGKIREGQNPPHGIPGITTWGRKTQGGGGSAGGHSAGEDSQTVKVAIPRHHFSPLISLH